MSSPDATSRPPVVVGVDGSEPSLAAVDLAAEEATAREFPLEIVHACGAASRACCSARSAMR